jgi:hypothetical protein
MAGVVCLAGATVGGLDAASINLWNNGPLNPSYSASQPSDSAATLNTVFDSFTTGPGAGWIVTALDITDWFVGVNPGSTRTVNWSIWKGDPLSTASNVGLLVAFANNVSGSVGSIINGTCAQQCSAMITVNLTSGLFLLPNTTYFLGVQMQGTDTTARVTTTGPGTGATQDGWEQSMGNNTGLGNKWSNAGCAPGTLNTCSPPQTGDTAFDIIGFGAPEPGTMLLMSVSLLGLGYKVRRRKA